MLIVQLYSGQNTSTGDFYYRIEQPAKWLSKLDGVEVVNIDLLNITDWTPLVRVPLLILHHLSDPDLLPVLTNRRQLGLPTVYELADNFHASCEHLPDAKKVGPPGYHVVMEELIKRCDAVQTTGGALQRRFAHLNDNFMIFPNLIEREKRSYASNRHSGNFTIGWGGSVRHLGDLSKFADAITAWVIKHPNTHLAIMGSAQVDRLFQNVPSSQLRYFKPGSLQDYLNFLDTLDVGIAPLLATEFNRCRSDVKFLEYASRGIVPLCSKIGPYSDVGEEGKSILLFNDSPELLNRLDELIMNPVQVETIARQAQRWVEENRLAKHYDWNERIELYTHLLPESVGVNADLAPTLKRMAQDIVGEILSDAMKNHSAAPRLKIEYPGHYQVYYFYGWALSKAGDYRRATEYLNRSLRKCPNSIRTAELLVRTQILNGEIDDALKSVVEALKIEPDLATLLVLKGNILQIKNRHREAFALFESVRCMAPRLIEAKTGYVRSAIHLGLLGSAENELLDLQGLIPESPDVWYFRALLSRQKNDFGQAKDYLKKVLKLEPEHRLATKLKNLDEHI